MKLNQKIKINKHLIYNHSTPYIIAEIGSNHNQKLNNAKKLLEIALSNKCNN